MCNAIINYLINKREIPKRSSPFIVFSRSYSPRRLRDGCGDTEKSNCFSQFVFIESWPEHNRRAPTRSNTSYLLRYDRKSNMQEGPSTQTQQELWVKRKHIAHLHRQRFPLMAMHNKTAQASNIHTLRPIMSKQRHLCSYSISKLIFFSLCAIKKLFICAWWVFASLRLCTTIYHHVWITTRKRIGRNKQFGGDEMKYVIRRSHLSI